jgi:hypothetical protein
MFLILGLLGIAFVVLKLTSVIAWSWWLVTLPFWGGAALIIALMVGSIILAALLSKK